MTHAPRQQHLRAVAHAERYAVGDEHLLEEAAGRAWVEQELHRVAAERHGRLDALMWTSDLDRDTHYVHFTIGASTHTVLIDLADLESVRRDASIQAWLAKHLRRTSA
ncbi:MAG: hypothetical protein AB1762_16395 [Gemmatimonadota bacterium]